MTPFAVIITEPGRVPAVLRLAAAAAALARPVALLFDGAAVVCLVRGATPPLLADAMALGVAVTACQTGLADAGLHADALADGVQTGGLVGFLADHAGAQIILA